jgi:uncharacterized protein (DUF4415 family)
MTITNSADLPELTEADIERLRRLDAMPDEEIDLSDIPEREFFRWKSVRPRGRRGRPATIWVESDVFRWLRAEYPDHELGPAVEDALRRLYDARRKPDQSEAA